MWLSPLFAISELLGPAEPLPQGLCVWEQKKNRQREGSCHSSTGSAEARCLSQLRDRVRAKRSAGWELQVQDCLCPARGRLLGPSESSAIMGRDERQADKQLAPVLRSTLLDPDFSPLAQRQVIVCLSRAEQLLAGSNAPGATEAGMWLGEVRTYS